MLTTNAGATAPEWAAAGSDTLGGLSCTPGQVAKWNGSAWACAADVDTDTDTTYTGSGGVTLTGTNFTADLGTDIVTGEIVDGTITAADLNLTDIDLADFTNTPGFITTDTDTTYTGSGGVTLTGTNFTADLGTSIDASEIDTDAVNDDEINYTNVTLADFTNDAGFVTTDNDTTYTGGTGITLTGTVFSNDLGTDIDASELVADAVQDSEIDYTAVTLADFTNDAGFVTTDNDTTYTASDGITLTGTNFTNNFSTAIETGEITDGTITFADLNNTDITLSDFTNDLALNSANIFVGNASNIASAVTVTGDVSISNIGAFTINDNSVDGTDIALGGDTAGDVMFYNGVDWSRLGIGTAGQVLQVNTGATAPEWTSAAATDGIQDANGDTQVQVEESANDDTIRFDTNGNEVMTVGPNGNVVINSAVSGVELDIAGQVRMDSLTVDNSTAAILGTTGSNYALRRNVDDNKLIVAGGNASNAGGNIHMFGGAHASLPNTVQFNSGTDETMRIEGDGDVLIGAAAETIDNAAFVMDGNDMFIAGDLGVEGAIYTDATATKYQTIDIFGCVRGSASSGTVAGGNSAVVRFDGGNNSQMRCSFAVPDDWVAGTDINIETYYSPSDNTTGDVQFQLRHAAKAVGEVIANGDFVDTVAGAETIAVNTELEMYELVEDIPAATLALDDMVNINLRRVPGNAADTYGGDINIHMLRIAYTGKRLE